MSINTRGDGGRWRRLGLLALVAASLLGWQSSAGPAATADGSGTYQLPNYTYGDTASTSYIHWQINVFGGGATPYVMVYSNTSIGYQASPAPSAGSAFYLHLATANVSVNEPGMFALALNPEASGLRALTDGSLPAFCRKGPIGAPVEFPCRGPLAGPTGTTWADPVTLAPGEQLDVQVPVVIDAPGSHVVSASCDESQFLQQSYKAQQVVPVGAGSQPPVTSPGPSTTAGQPGAAATLQATAVSRAGKLRVDIDPDLGKRAWRFRVDKRRPDGTWRPGKTYRTQGPRETRTINLKKGVYRVFVPAANGYQDGVSAPVTLLR